MKIKSFLLVVGEVAQSVRSLLCSNGNLNLISSIHDKMLDVLIQVCNCSTG